MKKMVQAAALAIMLAPSFTLAQDYNAGFRAAESGDFETAMKEWQPLAVQGDADAQFNLGIMYHNGEGIRVLKSGTGQSRPANFNRLSTRPITCRSGRRNSTFSVKQVWIAASLNIG